MRQRHWGNGWPRFASRATAHASGSAPSTPPRTPPWPTTARRFKLRGENAGSISRSSSSTRKNPLFLLRLPLFQLRRKLTRICQSPKLRSRLRRKRRDTLRTLIPGWVR
ncbi:unnamed protein product [Linum tenue]|uniref:Uncharacterized protein n=1 Tax=Linum tenue TaxID=586396 RepID=A0AAV0HZZ3_9ROSI|nr:unnamed protein product [Linum tenue]